MGKKKNEMRIVKNNSKKEDYTFVSDNITNNIKNNESINKEIKSGSKPNDRIKKKFTQRKQITKEERFQEKICKAIRQSMNNHIAEYKLPKS